MLVIFEPRRPVPEFMARWRALGIGATALPIHHDLDLPVVARLARHLRRLKPDIAHTHLIHADLYGAPAAHLAQVTPRGVVVLSTRHNDDPFRQRPHIRLQTRALGRLVDHYIAISEWVRRYTIEVEQVAPDRVTIIRYGLPPAEPSVPNGAVRELRSALGVPPDAPLVAVVARLVEQKGVAYLLDAFRRVASELPAARLLVVGDGPLRAALEAQAAALGVASRVRFTGWRDDAEHIIAAVDVLAMPSLWEGFGLVALEAMAHAKPVVATRVSALPEVVVDGETGWLVPPRDAQALADALLRALRQPEIARAQGWRGRQRLAECFSLEGMVGQTLGLYERLLTGRAAA